MFLRRQKREREESSSKSESPKLPGAERIPRHLGDVWQVLQKPRLGLLTLLQTAFPGHSGAEVLHGVRAGWH